MYQTITTDTGGKIIYEELPFLDEPLIPPATFRLSESSLMNALSLRYSAIARSLGNPEPAPGFSYEIHRNEMTITRFGNPVEYLMGIEFDSENACVAAAIADTLLDMAREC